MGAKPIVGGFMKFFFYIIQLNFLVFGISGEICTMKHLKKFFFVKMCILGVES